MIPSSFCGDVFSYSYNPIRGKNIVVYILIQKKFCNLLNNWLLGWCSLSYL